MAEAAHPIGPALEAAVPLAIADLQAMTAPAFEEYCRRWANPDVAQQLAEHGDNLLYKGKDTAALFAALARALAATAFAPGGVTFAGMHWEEHHHG